MRISVVVPTYQRRDVILRTLDTVFRQELDGEYETIVVVDGSTDGTADALRTLRPPCAFRIIEQPNRGLSAARNAGLRAARGEIVLFLDDDLLCDPGLLRAHSDAHREWQNTIVCGAIKPGPGTENLAFDLHRRVLRNAGSTALEGGELRWPSVAFGANDSAPREILLRAGGYDEAFVNMREEVELGIRLWKAGIRNRYHPGAVVHHSFHKTTEDLVRSDSIRFGRYELLLCRRYPEYRTFSVLSQPFTGRWSRRLMLQFMARFPLSPERPLRLACATAERLRAVPIMRWFGMHLLRARMLTAELRAAVAEAGSWRQFRHEFGR